MWVKSPDSRALGSVPRESDRRRTTHAAWRKSFGIQPRNIRTSIYVSGPAESQTIWQLVVIMRGYSATAPLTEGPR